MRVSTKTRYGLRAMVELARHYRDEPVKRLLLSENQGIPLPYLENILTALRIAGLIETRRGARGGLILASPPEAISLLSIFNILEGSLAPAPCADDSEPCHRENGCPTRKVWEQLKEAQEQVLRGITLADLLDNSEPRDFSI